MRIGFDIDGVLANFVKSYQNLVVATTGKDLFHTNDILYPPCWDWPQYRGYSNEEVGKVWNRIKADDTFWLNIEPLDSEVGSLKCVIKVLEQKHEVYYVSSRVGVDVKRQSKMWLIDKLNYLGRCHTEPTVLISGEKGEVAHALKLDAYIDDNFDNIVDVSVKSPTTRAYLVSRRYNQDFEVPANVLRIGTLGTMLDMEIALGNL